MRLKEHILTIPRGSSFPLRNNSEINLEIFLVVRFGSVLFDSFRCDVRRPQSVKAGEDICISAGRDCMFISQQSINSFYGSRNLISFYLPSSFNSTVIRSGEYLFVYGTSEYTASNDRMVNE
jgi:hypothetical protein